MCDAQCPAMGAPRSQIPNPRYLESGILSPKPSIQRLHTPHQFDTCAPHDEFMSIGRKIESWVYDYRLLRYGV